MEERESEGAVVRGSRCAHVCPYVCVCVCRARVVLVCVPRRVCEVTPSITSADEPDIRRPVCDDPACFPFPLLPCCFIFSRMLVPSFS